MRAESYSFIWHPCVVIKTLFPFGFSITNLLFSINVVVFNESVMLSRSVSVDNGSIILV